MRVAVTQVSCVENKVHQKYTLPRCVTFWCGHRRLGESISRHAEDLRGLASLCKFEPQSPQTVMFRLVDGKVARFQLLFILGQARTQLPRRPTHQASGWTPLQHHTLCTSEAHRLSCYSLRRCLNGSLGLPGLLPSEPPWFFLILSIIASRTCCSCVGCTSMMQISLSTTFQMCSMGLRSGDCGGHRSTVKSLSCLMMPWYYAARDCVHFNLWRMK